MKALRMQRDMSQSAIAEKLGVTFQQIQKYENGKNRISFLRLQRFCDALDVGLDYFTGEATATPPQDKLEAKIMRLIGSMPRRRKLALLKLIEAAA